MQINGLGLVALANAADPEKARELMEFDPEQFEQSMAKMRVKRDAEAPPKGKEDLRTEYNQLRQQLFNLQQNAKAYEIRTNEAAGKIRLIEQRINEALKQKKAAGDAGNLRGERTYEVAVQRLETELLDAQETFNKNKTWSGQAARALKDFNQHGRIAELKALLDAPLPEAKSASVPK